MSKTPKMKKLITITAMSLVFALTSNAQQVGKEKAKSEAKKDAKEAKHEANEAKHEAKEAKHDAKEAKKDA
ncbi:hypothetical protein, partial [Staphylococcus aureus]